MGTHGKGPPWFRRELCQWRTTHTQHGRTSERPRMLVCTARFVGGADAAMQLRLRTMPSLAAWGIQFLRNSRADAFDRNALGNLRLAVYSLDVLRTAGGTSYRLRIHSARGLEEFSTSSAQEYARPRAAAYLLAGTGSTTARADTH
jgi:hypothetical protein